jgi:sugar-specific transcriptional regulator TrmB
MLTQRQAKVLGRLRVENGFRPTGSDISTVRVLELKGLAQRIGQGRYGATPAGEAIPERDDVLQRRALDVLRFLEAGGDGASATEIADALRVRRNLLYGIIRTLSEAGKIERRPSTRDNRSFGVFLRR